jgi:hypothetical protein
MAADANRPAVPDDPPLSRRVDPRGFVEDAFFFGPDEAPLYAVLHAPLPSGRAGEIERPPILHVHSYGIEQIASYRMEVEMARAAAAAGFPVLRFHMTGCGDSFGEFADVTVDGMVADVVRAADLAAARGLRGQPILLGVRLGADVAVRAAAALCGVSALILWEPVPSPRAYLEGLLRSLLISNLAQGKRSGDTVATLLERLRAEGSVDVLGYPIHRRIYDEATPFAPPADAPIAQDALVVSIGKRRCAPAAIADAARLLATHGVRCETRDVQEEPGWQFNANPSFVSPALTETTLAWCLARFAAAADGGPARAGGAPATGDAPGADAGPADPPAPPRRGAVGRIEVR